MSFDLHDALVLDRQGRVPFRANLSFELSHGGEEHTWQVPEHEQLMRTFFTPHPTGAFGRSGTIFDDPRLPAVLEAIGLGASSIWRPPSINGDEPPSAARLHCRGAEAALNRGAWRFQGRLEHRAGKGA